MVQMVFVHGVKGPRTTEPTSKEYKAFRADADKRNGLFRDTAFGGALNVVEAIWGPHAAQPAWNLACVPHVTLGRADDNVALGGLNDLLGGAPAIDGAGTVLVQAARQDLPALIGGLSTVSLTTTEGAEAAEAARFWARAADVALTDDGATALKAAADDRAFAAKLAELASADRGDQVALGVDIGAVGQGILDLGGKLTSGLTDLVNSPAVLAVRDKLTPEIAIFIGDVFVYLRAGAARTAIRNTVTSALAEAAHKARDNNEKLVLAGHSMGGVILYDLMSDASVISQLSSALGFPFKADLLLTIGSQVALFEELKVFNASSSTYSATTGKVPAPLAGAGAWWNVWNRLDVLSFYAAPVFAAVTDFEASTSAGIAGAHGAYFTNTVFYRRLNKRLKENGFI